MSQTVTVPSALAEAIARPSGLNVTSLAKIPRPCRLRISCPVAVSQSFTSAGKSVPLRYWPPLTDARRS